MHNNLLFIIFTFIILITVIFLADNLMSAMIIVSLLANFLVISSNLGKIAQDSLNIMIQDRNEPTQIGLDEFEPKNEKNNEPLSIYEPAHEKWRAYQSSYGKYYNTPTAYVNTSTAEMDSSIDSANALIARKRARDKKCLEGLSTKDVNYYRYHYADELNETEDKVWWGRNEW